MIDCDRVMVLSVGPLIGLAVGVEGEREARAMVALTPKDARVLSRSLKEASDALSRPLTRTRGHT